MAAVDDIDFYDKGDASPDDLARITKRDWLTIVEAIRRHGWVPTLSGDTPAMTATGSDLDIAFSEGWYVEENADDVVVASADTITATSNPGGDPRLDLCVFDPTVPAGFEIIAGVANADPVPPPKDNDRQIVVGLSYMPAGATTTHNDRLRQLTPRIVEPTKTAVMKWIDGTDTVRWGDDLFQTEVNFQLRGHIDLKKRTVASTSPGADYGRLEYFDDGTDGPELRLVIDDGAGGATVYALDMTLVPT